MQVDWGDCGRLLVGQSPRRVSVFVAVLCYSRLCYIEFSLSQRKPVRQTIVPTGIVGKRAIHDRVLNMAGEGTVWKRLDQPYELAVESQALAEAEERDRDRSVCLRVRGTAPKIAAIENLWGPSNSASMIRMVLVDPLPG